MVEPPWDMVTKHQGYTCVDASLDHDPFLENNTRCTILCLRMNEACHKPLFQYAAWPPPN